eukprot:gene2252-2775_t
MSDERPEDCVPDKPENKEVREFLKNAPTTGLWMPLGKEVKVMQCWKCKNYGHRAADKECPLFLSGASQAEAERRMREDPMTQYSTQDNNNSSKQIKKESRLQQLKALLARAEENERLRKEKKRKRKEEKLKRKEEKKRYSSSGSGSSN